MPAEIIRHALVRAPDDSASLNFPGCSKFSDVPIIERGTKSFADSWVGYRARSHVSLTLRIKIDCTLLYYTSMSKYNSR